MGKIADFQMVMAQDAAIKYIEWVQQEENLETFQDAEYLCKTVPEYSL